MNLEPVVTEPSAPVVEPTEQAEPAPLSILEHAKAFGTPPKDETPEQAAERVEKAHHSAQQRREQETGKFEPGKVRHRAKSQQASQEDVPRIHALTIKLRAAEEEVGRLQAAHAAPRTVAKAEARVEHVEQSLSRTSATPLPMSATVKDPEPDENDPAFSGDYGKYLRAAAAWEGRKAYRAERAAERQQSERDAQNKVWDDRISKARERHAEFDTIADRVIQRIPSKSDTERFVFSDDFGEDMLVYFDTHPQELDAILQMPPGHQQFKALTLLSQRFASPTPAPAGNTTSAAERRTVVLPPRPPNVVRTEAQRASDDPAPTDGSLSIAEHRKRFAPKGR